MEYFRCKQFRVRQDRAAWKVGTDSMLLGSWVELKEATKAIDVGTGTGLLALMLSQRSSNLEIHGLEVHPGSIADASVNYAESPWADRLSLQPCSIQDYLEAPSLSEVDLIISNPPYFTSGVQPENPDRRMARHTVGFTHFDLLEAAETLLAPCGRLAVVLPSTEGEQFLQSANRKGLFVHRMCKVLSREHKPVRRYLLELGKEDVGNPVQETLVLHGAGRGYSEAFQKLTHAFHTIF